MPDTKMNLLERWFEEVWNKGREEAIDEMAAVDVVSHGLADPQGKEISGREAFHAFWRQFRSAFPDMRFVIEFALTDGDKVMVRCTAQATHQSDAIGLATTRKPVKFTGMVVARVRDGQLAEVWDNWDFLSLYQQLGAVKNPVI
jgi:steroid delta-isomerase-like uncharacterized protein